VVDTPGVDDESRALGDEHSVDVVIWEKNVSPCVS
jgi:hypothetical protein